MSKLEDIFKHNIMKLDIDQKIYIVFRLLSNFKLIKLNNL